MDDKVDLIRHSQIIFYQAQSRFHAEK